MQEKRQPALRLPFSYSGPGPSLRGWNACRGGRNDALSPSPDMDRNPTCEVGTPSRIEGVMLFHQFQVLMCGRGFVTPHSAGSVQRAFFPSEVAT